MKTTNQITRYVYDRPRYEREDSPRRLFTVVLKPWGERAYNVVSCHPEGLVRVNERIWRMDRYSITPEAALEAERTRIADLHQRCIIQTAGTLKDLQSIPDRLP